MNRIRELPKASSQLLSSAQIISSVQSVVKELVENSLDSCATNIEIKLEGYGLEKIEVKDNGKGILKDDISYVAKPHCTSKITSHLDLNKIETYGFRGEALAALCSVSALTVSTKTADEDFGFTYTFDTNGNVLTTKPCPCNQGTSIIASNLFKNIPVRKQFYRSDKIKKEELKRVEDILVSFGCIKTGVRFTLLHNRNLIWQKPSVHKTKEGLVHIFGNPVVDHMEICEFTDPDKQINIEVFLPKHNAPLACSQTSVSRSIVSINKRPVRMKVIDKLLKEYYNRALCGVNKSRYPICYIAIEMPSSSIDINLEPNKTAVAMENSSLIVDQLSKILSTFYSVDCNPETNTPKNIPTDTSDAVPTLVPSTQSNCTSNNLNVLSNKNTNSLFQMKLSSIAPDSKKIMSSKLSRKRESDTPSSKRMRTSSSFSTPPNDIHRHINTLKSFFATDKGGRDDTDLSLETSCNRNESTKLPVQKELINELRTQAREIPMLNNQLNAVTVQRSEENKSPTINNQCGAVKAQRAESCLTPLKNNAINTITIQRTISSDLDISGPLRANQFIVPIQRSESSKKPVMNEEFSDAVLQRAESNQTPIVINKFSAVTVQRDEGNEISVKRKYYDSNKNAELPANTTDITMKNKATHDHSKVIFEKAHTSDSHETLVENKKSEVPNSIDMNEWSRGLYSIEKTIQPVTVLTPKVTEKQQDFEGTAVNIESLEDKNESYGTSPNQRKITPFDFFCRKHRLEVASLHPDCNNHQIAVILTEKWSRLPMEEKAVYKNMVSKDYPKSIKNKENMRKGVSENLNKTKEKSTNLKKVVRKMKHKNKEGTILFSMDLLKNPIPSISESRDELDQNLDVISCLTPGVWVCSQQHKLYLLNCFRLQETIVFQRLLETYQFEPEPLESPFILTSHSLGDDGINTLSQMNLETNYKNEYIISDKNLYANGFKIRLLKGQNENNYEVIGMTPNVAFYGVSDLKEILSIVQKEGLSVHLRECRPGKTILYLQGEAVRIARQYPASKTSEDIRDLLSKKQLLSSNVCIHSKPFLNELYTIPTE